MQSSLRRSLATGLLGFLVPAGVVYAHSSAYAVLSGLSVSVIDLDLNDGIAAGFEITKITAQTTASVVNTGADVINLTVTRNRTTFEAMSAVAPVPPGFDVGASATYAGGQTGSVRVDVYSNLDGLASAGASVIYDFALKPHTKLTVSGTITGYGASAGEKAGAYEQYASVGGNIVFIPSGANGQAFSVGATVLPQPITFAFNDVLDTKTVSYAFSNTGSTQTAGEVYVSLGALVQNSALPVPELPTGSLLLMGLAAVGATVARSRR